MKMLHLSGLLVASTMLLSSSERSYVHDHARIEFTSGSYGLERSVEDQMDALMEVLSEGRRVELKVVAEHEVRNDYAEACRISLQRCQTLVSYLASRGIDEYNLALHQYRGHLLMRSVSVASVGSRDRGYVHSLSFSKHPRMPLMFTDSRIDAFKDMCAFEGLDNSKPQVIYHSSGAELHIPPFAFESYSGYDPDCASINLNFCYYSSVNDFVAADLTTNSGTRMLESGGMVYVGATCLGADLRLKKGIEIEILLPRNTAESEGMDLFLGMEQHGIVNWNRARAGQVQDLGDEDVYWEDEEALDGEGFSFMDGYLVRASNLGWINVDRFYNATQPTKLAVQLGEMKKDISVRMVFEDINSVMPGYYYNPDSLIMFEGIPVGESVKVLAFGKRDGQLYWDSQRITVGETRLINLEAKAVTEADFQANIASL